MLSTQFSSISKEQKVIEKDVNFTKPLAIQNGQHVTSLLIIRVKSCLSPQRGGEREQIKETD